MDADPPASGSHRLLYALTELIFNRMTSASAAPTALVLAACASPTVRSTFASASALIFFAWPAIAPGAASRRSHARLVLAQ
jgi:hypothetical protein